MRLRTGDATEGLLSEGGVVALRVVELDGDRRVTLEHSAWSQESPSLPTYLTPTEAVALGHELIAAGGVDRA